MSDLTVTSTGATYAVNEIICFISSSKLLYEKWISASQIAKRTLRNFLKESSANFVLHIPSTQSVLFTMSIFSTHP